MAAPSRPDVRRPLLFGGAALVLVLLFGVGIWLVGGGGTGGKDGPPTGEWPKAEHPILPGQARVSGSAVILPDGRSVDTGAPIDVYVAAGAGVYFLHEDDDELRVATVDGTVTDLGAHAHPDSLHVSPDGRHLAFLEISGKPWKAVVVDLVEGEEIVRSTDGMGRGVGLDELYAELEPTVVGLTDSAAYVMTTEDVVAFDLDSGDPEVLQERGATVIHESWYEELARTEDALGPQRAG